LPSWNDLAAQLGVARGTVRSAYERLIDEQVIISSKKTGTYVAQRVAAVVPTEETPREQSFLERYRAMSPTPLPFQMGVPALDCFPAKLFARLHIRAARADARSLASYPDLRGEPVLRREVAAYLALTRGLECSPSQIVITTGFGGGLGLVLHALGLSGHKVWVENPGFSLTRRSLELGGLSPVAIPVDASGIDVKFGIKHAHDAALAVVTPGQQAPLGVTLSRDRRLALLAWAERSGSWIIEDDYLGELQLSGRASPALASLDRAGRVIYVGTFSKTISPALRLGFVVAPPALASVFADVASCLAPAPSASVQRATADFLSEGHYLRHLRRLKRVYASRQSEITKVLRQRGLTVSPAGLSVILPLPAGAPDVAIASEALSLGIAPAPFSLWRMANSADHPGLVLGVAPTPVERAEEACDTLLKLVGSFS
jgi:GntR family transcriptional regulator/MocR family aminotransferase